jgi:hypothetical protein
LKSKSLDKLVSFYVLIGKLDKLKILTDVFSQQAENSRRFLTSIYTNNIEDKIKNLTETGHCNLDFIIYSIPCAFGCKNTWKERARRDNYREHTSYRQAVDVE